MRADLVAQDVEENPHRAGPAYARLADSGVEIWALVAYLRAADGDVARVACDYELPPDAIDAALAYDRRHKKQIDARIARNTA